MIGSAVYGGCLGFLVTAVNLFAPQPTGAVLLWAGFALQLAWGASVCWRRTRLPFATAAMAAGAVGSAGLSVLAAFDRVFPDAPIGLWLPFVLAGPVFLLIEARVHPERWAAWKAYMEDKSAWDIFTGRHIPDFYAERPGGPAPNGTRLRESR